MTEATRHRVVVSMQTGLLPKPRLPAYLGHWRAKAFRLSDFFKHAWRPLFSTGIMVLAMVASVKMKKQTMAVFRLLMVGLGIFFVSHGRAEVSEFSCGPLRNAYGPYDYRSDKDKLPIVEGAHFTSEVANLVRGTTAERPGGDIDYTLRAFPNHPGALMSMVRLGDKEKTAKPSGSRYTVECWLNRAVRFRDNDATVKMIYATYLAKKGSNAEALKQLNDAVQLGEDNPNLQYNIGLVYFNLGQYDEALNHAHLAYQAGFPLPGLRDKLKKAGKWKELSASALW